MQVNILEKVINRVGRLERKASLMMGKGGLQKVLGEKRLICLSFDVEEDWDIAGGKLYYNSYYYVKSGAFEELLRLLRGKGISATFYVTPNFTQSNPIMVKEIEAFDHCIGVHLHTHNFELPSFYPFIAPPEHRLVKQPFAKAVKYMKSAKNKIESVVGHEVVLFRPGHISCNPKVEKAAGDAGFQAISAYPFTCRFLLTGLWNLPMGRHDMFDPMVTEKERYKTADNSVGITGYFAHPMSLYDYSTHNVRFDVLASFTRFIEKMILQPNVCFVNHLDLLSMCKGVKIGRGFGTSLGQEKQGIYCEARK
jgi:peptidoglycan/xylan/chitin deacetylase (PgdA/CDA1 family)